MGNLTSSARPTPRARFLFRLFSWLADRPSVASSGNRPPDFVRSRNMSEEDKPKARSRLRVWLVATVVSVAVLVLTGFLLDRFGPGAERREYYRISSRISVHLKAIEAELHAGVSPASHLQRPDRTRAEVVMAVTTAMWNERFRREPDGTHHKLEALADRFERTNAAELKTEVGCLQLVVELEREFPDAHDYAWFEMLRQYQDEKWIPRLADLVPKSPPAKK